MRRGGKKIDRGELYCLEQLGRNPLQKKREQEERKLTCRDCRHSYGSKERDYEGKLMLCHCDVEDPSAYTDYKKYYKFLDDRACRFFEEQL